MPPGSRTASPPESPLLWSRSKRGQLEHASATAQVRTRVKAVAAANRLFAAIAVSGRVGPGLRRSGVMSATLGAAPVRSWAASSARVVSRRWYSASIAQFPRSGSASRAGLTRAAVRRLDPSCHPTVRRYRPPGASRRIRQSTANPFCGGPAWVDRPMPRVQLTLPATSARGHPPVTNRLEDARGVMAPSWQIHRVIGGGELR